MLTKPKETRKQQTNPAQPHLTASQAMQIAQRQFVNRTVMRATLHNTNPQGPAYVVHFSDGSSVVVCARSGQVVAEFDSRLAGETGPPDPSNAG